MASLPPATVTPPSSAFDWFQDNFARVIGFDSAAQLPLPAPGAAPDGLALQRLATSLNKRFPRYRDPVSGNVTFATVGDVMAPLPDDATSDPTIAGMAQTYVGAASALVGSIDAGLCLPGSCPGEFDGRLDQIRDRLDALRTSASLEGNRIQTRLRIDELANDEYGLLPGLQALVTEGQHRAPTVVGERACASIDLAVDALRSFQQGLDAREEGGCETLADFLNILRRCAGSIPAYVDGLSRAFNQAGIGPCELANVKIELAEGAIEIGGTCFSSLSLPEALAVLRTMPASWARLAEGAGIDAVRRSGAVLREIVTALERRLADIPDGFQLNDAAQAQLRSALGRLVHYAGAVLDEILRSGGYGDSPVPEDECKPIKR